MARRCLKVVPRCKRLVITLGSLLSIQGAAHAYTFDTGPDWLVNFDNTVMYTMGWRAESRDKYIGNHPFFAQGDYKFDRGDMVTNRIQNLMELQAIYKNYVGFRASASMWKDFAYSDTVKTNPNPAFSTILSYPDGRFSDWTKKYHIQGAELLDAFAFLNTKVADVPVYLKAGRLTQYWGNSFFFGFSNIGYSQSPVDYIKGFSQPGSEIKELFLPRGQLLAAADLTPELSIAGQYFFEFDGNRYPEGGTYLGPFDILYQGPTSGGALAGAFGGPVSAGHDDKPKGNNRNFGVKVAWTPEWANGDLGFYYRQFDETHPWPLVDVGAAGGGRLHTSYAKRARMLAASYETKIGSVSTGWEVSYRTDTGLNSALTNGIPGVPTEQGATGDLVNVIGNGLISLSKNSIWDAGTLIAEFSYTHLNKVTGNAGLYKGIGSAACTDSVNPALPGDKWDGCGSRNALAVAVLFSPMWFQVFPGIDVEMPMSLTWGVKGNPAYTAGSFYAQGTKIYSVGVKATYNRRTSLTLAYNGYRWAKTPVVDVPGFGPSYSGFGGNGATALNDKGWVSLTLKTSF